MSNNVHSLLRLLAAAVLPTVMSYATVAAAAPADGSSIEVWTRGPTPPPAGKSSQPASHDKPQTFALDSLPQVEGRRVDVQYQGAFFYRGVPVETLIQRYAPPADLDLALLHFSNGMQIPLPFRDAQVMKRLAPLIARAMRIDNEGPMMPGRFPSISRPRAGFVDVRPITFSGNKLVVSDRGHPMIPPEAQQVLSPWKLADSLTGIELVAGAAYYAQFNVDPDPAVQKGQKLFTESCQFCHGARHVGAAFGWDFVEPQPIYSYRGRRNLFHHIKYKPLDASAKGLMMPALSYMTEEDAQNIWQWLRAIAQKPMPPYGAAAAAPAATTPPGPPVRPMHPGRHGGRPGGW